MKGFDPRWTDLPDYILGITKEIWEERGVAKLHHWYGKDMLKRGSHGIVVGAQAVIDETNQSIAHAPDLQLLGEDVIWSGNEDDGYLSSHRVLEIFSDLDDDGRPTGRRIVERVIADCYCIADQITDEWLVYDRGASARQRGLTPREAAASEIAAEGGPEKARRPFTWKDDRAGPYTGKGNDGEWGQRYEDMLRRVMAADFAALPGIYDRAVHLELPGGRTDHGVTAADRFWVNLRAAFPSARLEIEHRIGREDAGMPPRSAVRFSLIGKHEGRGMFGPPTGATVHLRGTSHAEWSPWGLRRDYILFDEVHVWKQILLHQG
ncbi:MAG: nuclear transport factor 2 family protein [Paracoccaceae bacterium]